MFSTTAPLTKVRSAGVASSVQRRSCFLQGARPDFTPLTATFPHLNHNTFSGRDVYIDLLYLPQEVHEVIVLNLNVLMDITSH